MGKKSMSQLEKWLNFFNLLNKSLSHQCAREKMRERGKEKGRRAISNRALIIGGSLLP
jgi:hypothetical protein